MIDIAPQELATVQRLITTSFPAVEARVFGSRYSGTVKPYSDLDNDGADIGDGFNGRSLR